eukprot:3322396-Pyramimonas_sp.AAC.1
MKDRSWGRGPDLWGRHDVGVWIWCGPGHGAVDSRRFDRWRPCCWRSMLNAAGDPESRSMLNHRTFRKRPIVG